MAHRGSVVAAKKVLESIRDILSLARSQYPIYPVALTGHSFGGSTAAVLGVLLKPGGCWQGQAHRGGGVLPAWLTYRGVMAELPDVKVFTFGTMPCMSLELAEACRSFVTTVVNGDDVVPRVRRENLQKLRGEVRDLGAATDARAAEPHPPSALLSVHVPVTSPPLYPSSLQLAQVRWQAELRDSVLDEAARARISTMFKTAHDHLESRRALVSQRCTYSTPHLLLACGILRSTRTPSVHTVGTNQRAPRVADQAGASTHRDHEAARRGCRGVARFWCAACCVRCAACQCGDSQFCAGLMKRLRDVLAKLGSMDVHHSLQ